MGKVFAISDLHGMYNLWKQVQESLQSDDILYMLGDAADRGPRGWDIIKEALTHPQVVYIRGNHDEMLLDAVKHSRDYNAMSLWYWNGGQATHDAMMEDPNYEQYVSLLNKTEFYKNYKNTQGQTIHLSHAGFSLLEDDKLPWNEDLIWDRNHIIDPCPWWPETNPNDYVVHGHTYCASKSAMGLAPGLKLNDSKTVGRYCHGHKICIDGRSFMYNRCALLDLDTLEEKVIKSDATEEILY